MKQRKVVSQQVRLQALALFTMANQNYLRAEAYGASLAELLGYDDSFAAGFGDEWLQKGASFDSAFKAEGFVVAHVSKLRKRRKSR